MTGLGRKVWNAGDVLAAADVNGYLMDQSVMYFANASARTAAIAAPTAGMHTFRADGTVVEVYNGSAWVSANSVGGSVTINNSNVTNTLTTIAGTAHDIVTGNQGQTLYFTSGSAVTATLSTAAAFTAGQRVDLIQDGAGTVTVTAGSGVTLAGRGTAVSSFTLSQYDGATIFCVGSNNYRIIGNVRAV
jgi:hypothetical protein